MYKLTISLTELIKGLQRIAPPSPVSWTQAQGASQAPCTQPGYWLVLGGDLLEHARSRILQMVMVIIGFWVVTHTHIYIFLKNLSF
jgi:hypothetical protein